MNMNSCKRILAFAIYLTYVFLVSLVFIAAASPPDDTASQAGDVNVPGLKEAYGQPLYHFQHDPPLSENLGIGTLTYDEEIAFDVRGRQLTYYFLQGEYQARAAGDLPDDKPLRIPAKVVRVIDGDTIVVRLSNGPEGKVRNIGTGNEASE